MANKSNLNATEEVLYDDPNCKAVQKNLDRVGYHVMCKGDEDDTKTDVVLPASDDCDHQVNVLSKYGVVAVCDEEDDVVAEKIEEDKKNR